MNARHSSRSLPGTTACLAVALLVPMAIGGCTGLFPAPGTASESASPVTAEPEDGAEVHPGEAMSIPDLVDAVEPSVVTIFTGGGLGSGVVYTEAGVIITNAHVVAGATDVQISFADGQRVAGRVLASDPIVDIAVVEADRDDLPAADFATALPEVGETAVVIGSPLGLENTVTSGIVSGVHRQIPGSAAQGGQSLVDLIQTDAAISPGNSGGAVVNLRGEIIGISEAYIPPSAGAVSLGFAIPAATATEVADQLLEDGTADHAFLGLVPGPITPQIQQQLGLTESQGVVVLSVSESGPADDAGLRPGDVLVSIDGEAVRSPEELLGALRQRNPGDAIAVEYVRGGEQQTAEVTLVDRPQ